MSVYDLTASVDLVLSVTGYSKVDIVGVSLGATLPLIMLSERPEYNEKIRNLIMMAPASRMSTIQGFSYFFYRRAINVFLVIMLLFETFILFITTLGEVN